MTTDKPLTGQATEEAVDWYLSLRVGAEHNSRLSNQGNGGDVTDFDRWLTENEQHQQEFKKVDDCWLASGGLKDTGQVAKSRDIIEQLKAQVAGEIEQAGSTTWRSSAKALLATAASLVVAVALYWVMGVNEPLGAERFYTQLGEQRRIALTDGSSINLNTKSTVDVTINDEVREIVLHRGQANFNVAHDKSRPFRVKVGCATVTALGTSFDIYKSKGITVVSLFDGSVEVVTTVPAEQHGPGQSPQISKVVLSPGEQLRYVDAEGSVDVGAFDPSQLTAWQEGRMKFHKTPLAQAIKEVNRYSNIKVKLHDKSLAALPVSGIFQQGRNEDFVRAVVSFHGLKMVSTDDRHIVITRDGKIPMRE
jgi:transmembrane sensor